MKILTFSTLFPNAAQPVHGVFVENRLRHLLADGGVQAHVVAPVPWFPLRSPIFGHYADFAKVPKIEHRHGLTIHHPRFPLIPKIGTNLAPLCIYAFVKPFIAGLIRDGLEFDLIDSHYFYPDGVAAAMLGRAFGKPVTITARGTDLNLLPEYPIPRRQIKWAADKAQGLITVCQALKDELVDLEVPPDKVRVLRNGVDLEMFKPVERAPARDRLGLTGRTLLSVGLLIERKGHNLIIEALPKLPDTTLLIAGDGPERAALERLARDRGVADRVRFLGRVGHNDLGQIYGAVDALVLASSREGWANVLLEAMACGTPVVASNVWGTPEIVAEPAAGVLMAERTPAALADAVEQLFAAQPDRAATRAYAEQFSWEATTAGQKALFDDILGPVNYR
ncbi:MAG: glycosyltransferase [Alphaproteobacteria bacterium]|nr:glycosyltransferase [Alphaproteobacteria bacterium]